LSTTSDDLAETTGYEQRRTLAPDVAELLRRHRLARGWSYRQAAKETGVSYSYLAMLEAAARAPSVVLAEALIDAYGIGPGDAEALRSAALVGVGRDWSPR
jgi:transcriptional regulator with XRE-family HTH domain